MNHQSFLVALIAIFVAMVAVYYNNVLKTIGDSEKAQLVLKDCKDAKDPMTNADLACLLENFEYKTPDFIRKFRICGFVNSEAITNELTCFNEDKKLEAQIGDLEIDQDRSLRIEKYVDILNSYCEEISPSDLYNANTFFKGDLAKLMTGEISVPEGLKEALPLLEPYDGRYGAKALVSNYHKLLPGLLKHKESLPEASKAHTAIKLIMELAKQLMGQTYHRPLYKATHYIDQIMKASLTPEELKYMQPHLIIAIRLWQRCKIRDDDLIVHMMDFYQRSYGPKPEDLS